jgi:DNA-binding response OmpR family regulator
MLTHRANPDLSPKPLLLLVDDMPDNLQVLEAGLNQDYRLVMARHGERALHIARAKEPDLILLDIMMPGLDGFEVCRQLKADPVTAAIPVIFLTALDDEENEMRGLDLDAADYIHKPFNMALVRRRISAHVRARQAQQALAERNQALEEAARQRDEIDRVLRHDLKSPLSPIMGLADLMLDEANLNDEQRENLRMIYSSGEKILGMIQRSLDLYKMETKRYVYCPKPQDIPTILRGVASGMRFQAKQFQVNLQLEGVEQPLSFPVEDMLLHVLLDNLVLNAIEASAPKDLVRLSLNLETDSSGRCRLVICVRNPTLVPEAIRPQFFAKYVTSGKPHGTGLGTYSARLMAETMGGQLEMHSEIGQGTCLTLSLPEPCPDPLDHGQQ